MTVADVLGGRISEEAKQRAKAKILKVGRGAVLDELSIAERELREEIERRKRSGVIAHARATLHYVDLFQEFQKRAAKWRDYQQHTNYLTQKQRIAIMRRGYDPDARSFEENKRLLESFGQPSERQLAVLIRAGYTREELAGLRSWEVSKLIGQVKANGWRRRIQ